MPTPRITYQKGLVDPGWTHVQIPGSSNGLIVSSELIKARRKEQIESAREERGKLFGEWTKSQYAVTNNTIERSSSRVPHPILEAIARECSLDQAIISTIIQTAMRFTGVTHAEGRELGFRIIHDRHYDTTFSPDEHELENIRQRCKHVEHIALSGNSEVEESFGSFLGAVLNDECVIDRKVMIKKLDANRKPIGFHWLPGATIRPTLKLLKPYMEEWGVNDKTMLNPQRAGERLSYRKYKEGLRDQNGNPINFSKARYVQVLEQSGSTDRIVAAWEDDEISVDIVRKFPAIDEVMYGYSALEQSLKASKLWMQAWDYQAQMFNPSWPEAILVLRGDYDAEGLEAFRQQVVDGSGNPQRMPVIAAGAQQDGMDAQMLELRKTNTEMMFADLLNFLIQLKCSYYGLRPSSLNWPATNPDPVAAQGVNFLVPAVMDTGIRGRMEHFARWFTKEIIKPHDPDLKLEWVGLEMVTEDARIQRELGLMQMKTFNESRSAVGLKELPPGLPKDSVGDWIPNAEYVAIVGQILAEQAQQQQGAPQNPSELSQPAGQGGSGDFGQGADMPSPDDQEQQQAAQDAGTQPAPPMKGAQPMAPAPAAPPEQAAPPLKGATG